MLKLFQVKLNLFIAISKSTKDHLIKYSKITRSKIIIIHNPVSEKLLKSKYNRKLLEKIRKKTGERSRQISKKMSWEKVALSYIKIYKSLL